jgi:predicted PurR-regulated permease PerM
MARPAETSANSPFVLLVSASIIIAGLYFGREVLVPIALAVLLSFMLSPPVRWLERLRLPRTLAVIVVVLLAVGSIGGLGYMAKQQAVYVVDNFESYKGQFRTKMRHLGGQFGFINKAEKAAREMAHPDGHPEPQAPAPSSAAPLSAAPSSAAPSSPIPEISLLKVPPPALATDPQHAIPVRIIPDTPTPLTIFREYAASVLSPLATTIIVLAFVIFMLIDKESLRDRIIRLLGSGRLNLTTQALDEASTRISDYLGALAIVNACYSICTALGLWLIPKVFGNGSDFPNVLVWAIFVGLLRFVPYVGIWIGAGIPLILSFALFPGNGVFFAVLVMFLALEVVVSQFIEPMWYGSSTGMSPLAVLVAAVFWTWLWGAVGLLLSTPMTVILVVMGKYVPQLKFLDILLREEPVLSPPFRFYQRLIAMDQDDAAEIAGEYLKEKKSLQVVYDDLLVTALSMAERDSHHERVADEQLVFVRQSVRDLADELAEQYSELPDKPAAAAGSEKNGHGGPPQTVEHERRPRLPLGCNINVLCLPARDESDEILARMFARLLEVRGYCVVTTTPDALAAEMTDMVESKHIDVVCISAMPPAAVAHARYLCKRLGARCPDVGVVVGLWTLKGDLSKAKERLACRTGVQVVATLADAQEQLDQLTQSLLSRTAAKPAGEPLSTNRAMVPA